MGVAGINNNRYGRTCRERVENDQLVTEFPQCLGDAGRDTIQVIHSVSLHRTILRFRRDCLAAEDPTLAACLVAASILSGPTLLCLNQAVSRLVFLDFL